MATPLNHMTAYTGTIIHSTSPSDLQIILFGAIIVDGTGLIVRIIDDLTLPNNHVDEPTKTQELKKTLSTILQHPESNLTLVQTSSPTQFLVPSFIDTHVHAPQFSMRGLGQGLHILDWLEQITFPHEAKFADERYARRVYERCVAMGLRQGITTACYFGSLHPGATKILADECWRQGQRAFVGKTCMDHARTNAAYYREETAAALAGTRELIEYCRDIDARGDFVRPVITPRFAISCTSESLRGLGGLAAEYAEIYASGQGVINQTHFCEARQEIDATLAQYPGFTCEADLYEEYGLLDGRSVLAHCTLLEEADLKRIIERDCGIAHCPISNTTVGGGFMAAPVRQWLSRGMVKIGLGTDSGGGFSSSILDVMRQALIVGNAREMLSDGQDARLSLEEIFYMATLGGAKVLGIDDRVGSFEHGKAFDAILVDMGDDIMGVQTMLDDEAQDLEGVRQMWSKWIMTGDDRNLRHVWVGGVQKK